MRPELHPACAAFPALPQNDLQDLAADIRQNGLLEPVTLTPEGLLLDGRCRWDACELVGVEPRTVTYDGNDPIGFVLSKNKNRRHMTVSQKALAMGRIANLRHGSNQYQVTAKEDVLSENILFPPLSGGDLQSGRIYTVNELVTLSGVSRGTIQNGRLLAQDAEPHIVAMVESGAVNIRVASEAVRHTPRAVQATWTQADVERRGREVISAYPSNQPGRTEPKPKPKPKPAKRAYIDPPYQPMKFPTREETGAPPPGSSLAEHDAFFEKYGRTPLHPKTVADALIRTGGARRALDHVVEQRDADRGRALHGRLEPPLVDRARRERAPSARERPEQRAILRGERPERVGEPAEQHGQEGALDRGASAHALGERLQVAQRAGRVLVAQRLEPRARGVRGQPRLVGGEPRHGGQQGAVEQLLVKPPHLAGMAAPLGL